MAKETIQISKEITKTSEDILKKSGEIDKIEDNLNKLYTVQNFYTSTGNEKIQNIAIKNKIDISILKTLNPNIDENTIIKKGVKIRLQNTLKPNLSISEQNLLKETNIKIEKKKNELEILKNTLKDKIILKIEIEAKKVIITDQNLKIASDLKGEFLSNPGKEEIIKIKQEMENNFINSNPYLQNLKTQENLKAEVEYKNNMDELKEIEQLLDLKDSSGTPYREYYQSILFDFENYRTNPNFIKPIPKKTILLLLIMEGSKGKINFDGPGTAYGLGQITNDTWSDLNNSKHKIYSKYNKSNLKLSGETLPTKEDQLKSICILIDAISRKYNCSAQESLKYYNMGLNGGDISKKTLHKYIKTNTAIAGVMVEHKLKEKKITLKDIIIPSYKKQIINQIEDANTRNSLNDPKIKIENKIDEIYNQGKVKIANIRGFLDYDKFIVKANPTTNEYEAAGDDYYGGKTLKYQKQDNYFSILNA